MRTALLLLTLLLLAAGCARRPAPRVDRVEMRMSGWVGIDVSVGRDGKGRYHISDPFPNGRSGGFYLTADDYARLVARLEPYRLRSEPVTEAGLKAMVLRDCPDGEPAAADRGALWIRWRGPGLDRHFLADFNCRSGQGEERALRAIFGSLPVPEPGAESGG